MKSFNLAEVFDRVIVLELAMHEHVEADFLLERHTLGTLLSQKGPYSVTTTSCLKLPAKFVMVPIQIMNE